MGLPQLRVIKQTVSAQIEPVERDNDGRVELPETGKILTMKGLSEEAQKLIALLKCDAGYVAFVSQSHKNDAFVLGALSALKRKGVNPQIRYCAFADIEKIKQKYGELTTDLNASKGTVRQDNVVAIIKEAVQANASDVHIVVSDHTTVRMRIDGDLFDRHQYGRDDGDFLMSTIYQSMCDVSSDPTFIRTKSQDARLRADFVKSLGIKGARVATRPTDSGILMVLRLLYERKHKADLLTLGYLPEHIEMFRAMQARTNGINILSGPTGSGKSTTLETVLTQLIQESGGKINVITLEDPPEYEIVGARQTPVLYDKSAGDDAINEAWAKGIANCMRLDPDTLMIGEMRDLSSAVAAFRAAMTGHNVYTTLHANNAVHNLVRLRDIGVDIGLLTDPMTVTGLVNQSLAAKPCPHCKVPYSTGRHALSRDLIDRIEKFCKTENVWLRGPGCPSCNHTGIKGRTVIAEVILPTKQFMEAYLDHGQLQARQCWYQTGGITKNAHMIRAINEGLIDPQLAEKSVCAINEDELTIL